MTRLTEPYPSGPYRRFQGIDERALPAGSGRPTPIDRQTNLKRRPRGLRLAGIISAFVVSFALLAAGGFYLANTLLTPTRETREERRPTADATVIFSGRLDQLNPAPGNAVQQDPSDPSVVWLRSSLKTAKSNGSTDGVSVKVPAALLEKLQGRRIRVTVSAKGAGDGAAPFALAYSMGGSGNSGWVVFEPKREFEDFSLSFAVPRRATGPDHYVGIWSDIAGRNTPLAIRQLTVTILP